MGFNVTLARHHYGVETESELRQLFYGEKSDVTDDELKMILEAVAELLPVGVTYVEVGVYFGGTFLKVLKEFAGDPHFKAIGIDLFEDLIDEAWNEDQTHELYGKWGILNSGVKDELELALSHMGFEGFELVKGDSSTVLSELQLKTPAVFFIDGNHTYEATKNDAHAAISVAAPGSILIFHNASLDIQPDPQYVARDGGPLKVCQELLSDLEWIGQRERCQGFRIP